MENIRVWSPNFLKDQGVESWIFAIDQGVESWIFAIDQGVKS